MWISNASSISPISNQHREGRNASCLSAPGPKSVTSCPSGGYTPFQQNNRVVFGCCPPVKIAGGQWPGSARVPHSKPRSGPILRMNAAICIYMYTKYANRPGTSRHKWGSRGRVPYRIHADLKNKIFISPGRCLCPWVTLKW